MISVIIPVYNAEAYLACCLDAVLRSAHDDFELLLVNDGSTDRSLEICAEYARRDSRVRLFTQENQGVSAARNRGLAECAGEWVVFVDADDVISPDFLGLAAQAGGQDLLLFDFSETEEALFQGGPAPETIVYDRERLPEVLCRVLVPRPLAAGGRASLLSPCAKAYKRSVISRYGLRFDTEIFHGEDRLFNLEYLLRAESCAYCPHPVYFYRTRGDSASHRFSPELARNHARLLERMKSALEKGRMLAPLRRYYDSYALDNLTSALIWGIFHPRGGWTDREKRAACRAIRENALYRQALADRRAWGRPARRILLFCFRRGWYPAVSAICGLSGRYLERRMFGQA